MDRRSRNDELPPELSPLVAKLRRRAEEDARAIARLRRELDEARAEIDRLRREVQETDLRRVAEVGAVRHDMEEERGKNAVLREKLIKAETDKRSAARDMLDARLSTTTQEAERRALEREIATLRAEVERLRGMAGGGAKETG